VLAVRRERDRRGVHRVSALVHTRGTTAGARRHHPDVTTDEYTIGRRPSATFLILKRESGRALSPGSYLGEIEAAGIRASCAITVPAGEGECELWCQPRDPLPLRLDAGARLSFTSGSNGPPNPAAVDY
jgi:hypothetical protein